MNPDIRQRFRCGDDDSSWRQRIDYRIHLIDDPLSLLGNPRRRLARHVPRQQLPAKFLVEGDDSKLLRAEISQMEKTQPRAIVTAGHAESIDEPDDHHTTCLNRSSSTNSPSRFRIVSDVGCATVEESFPLATSQNQSNPT